MSRVGAFGLRDSWDDLVQEVLISVIEKPPRTLEAGAIVRHIQTTTYRRYVDELRRLHGRKRKREDDSEDSTGAWRQSVSLEDESAPNPLAAPSEEALELGLRRALARLEPRKRDALQAVYVEGFTYEEAARELDVPLGTLKLLLREARIEMKSLLTEPPGNVSDLTARSDPPSERAKPSERRSRDDASDGPPGR